MFRSILDTSDCGEDVALVQYCRVGFVHPHHGPEVSGRCGQPVGRVRATGRRRVAEREGERTVVVVSDAGCAVADRVAVQRVRTR